MWYFVAFELEKVGSWFQHACTTVHKATSLKHAWESLVWKKVWHHSNRTSLEGINTFARSSHPASVCPLLEEWLNNPRVFIRLLRKKKNLETNKQLQTYFKDLIKSAWVLTNFCFSLPKAKNGKMRVDHV